jgi:hypothetical protein
MASKLLLNEVPILRPRLVGRTRFGDGGGFMKQTPYYRSPTSIVSFLAGAAAGFAVSSLFTPPPSQTGRVKVVRKAGETVDEDAQDGKRSQ